MHMAIIEGSRTVVATPGPAILIDGREWVRARTAGVHQGLTDELLALGGGDGYDYLPMWDYASYLRRHYDNVRGVTSSEPGETAMLNLWLMAVVFEAGHQRFAVVQVHDPKFAKRFPPTVYHTACTPEAFETFAYTARCDRGHHFRVSCWRTVEASAGPGAAPLNLRTPGMYDLEQGVVYAPGGAIVVCPGCDEHDRVPLTVEMAAPDVAAIPAGQEMPEALRVYPREEGDAVTASAAVLRELAAELALEERSQGGTTLTVREHGVMVQHRDGADGPVRTIVIAPVADGRYRLSRTWLAMITGWGPEEVDEALGAVGAAAAECNSQAVFHPGSGQSLTTDAAPLPCIEVAGAVVYAYVEDDDEGLRLVVSVHLDGDIPEALLREGNVPLTVTVNSEDVFVA
jgi:hypothetical protein